jgi:diguanylate cyclase (GGDEF)-like protein
MKFSRLLIALLMIGHLLFCLHAPLVLANATIQAVDENVYKDPQKALAVAEAAIKALPAKSRDRAHWQAIAADSAMVLELPEQALRHTQAGLASLTESERDAEMGQRLLISLAASQSRTGKVQDSIKTINDVIANLESKDLPAWLLVEALTERADMNSNAGNFREALADLLQAYALAQPTGNRGLRGDVAGYLGNVYMAMGDYELATQYSREGLASAIQRNELVTQSIEEFGLAQALQLSGQLVEAEQYYASSRLHSEQVGDPQGVAFANLGLADMALNDKKYDKAERMFRSALPIFITVKNIYSQASIALGLGEIALARGNFQNAYEQANHALQLIEKANSHGHEMRAHDLLSKVYVARGEYQSAFMHSSLARQIEKATLIAARNLSVAGMEERFDSERQKQEAIYYAASISLLILVGFLIYAGYKNSKLRDKLSKLALTDVLTGIANRRSVMAIFEQEFIRARRYGFPLSVAMLDLDHFKSINDSFGHDAGDEVLREFCQMVREHLRLTDSFGRWGGEEFIIIFPHTSADDAIMSINRIRAAMSSLPYKKLRGERQATFSAGLAFQTSEDVDVDALIKRADGALYLAKNSGRNRMEMG